MFNVSGSGQTTYDDGVDASSNQIVFIDSAVLDDQSLLDGLAPGTQVYLLDPTRTGCSRSLR